MSKAISLLGSTGSIGRQTLEVCEALGIPVLALTANQNVELLEAQCRKFRPSLAACMDPEAARTLKIKLADTGIKVFSGMEGLLEAAIVEGVDAVHRCYGYGGLTSDLGGVGAWKAGGPCQ